MNVIPADTKRFANLSWQAGGRTRAGIDCVGLAWLWLKEHGYVSKPLPGEVDGSEVKFRTFDEGALMRGSVVFFALRHSDKPAHVAVYLGDNRYLHTVANCPSRVECGLTLLGRLGMRPIGFIHPEETEALCKALAQPELGWVAAIAVAIALASAAASYFFQPRLAGFSNKHGRYATQQGLATQKSSEIPLADILGTVTVAGNQIYQQLPDNSQTGSQPAPNNTIIILASGPVSSIDYVTGLKIKGVSWSDKSWFNGSAFDGILIDPAQSTDNPANSGILNADTGVPSLSLLGGTYGIDQALDVRANWDRDFPVHGLPAVAGLILRNFDTSKFSGLNWSVRIIGRSLRTYNSGGFANAGVVGESLAGADGVKVRFKLAYEDVQSIAGVTVNAVSYTLMDSSHQSGNVYSVNLTKGYIEFPTAPAAAATISVGYNHYTTAQTSCPADQILYLLTDKLRGKGIDSSRIDFASFVAFQTYCNASITVQGATGEVTQARYAANYVVDDRKPFQDHIQAILDVCNGALVLSNGKFVIVPRSGGSSVFDFDSSNILVNSNGLSSLQPELLDRSTRANRIKVLFSSDASLNSEDGAVADDTANQDDRVGRIGNNGVVEDNLKFPALADPDQAQRLANQLVAEQVRSNWLYTWKTNIQGLALQPGDLVTVTHDATLFYPPAPTLMRIESLDYDEEDILTIVASQYVSDAYL